MAVSPLFAGIPKENGSAKTTDMTDQTLKMLVQALGKPDAPAQQTALASLVERGGDAVPALIEAFNDTKLSSGHHHRVALALGRIGSPQVITWLIARLNDDAPPAQPYLAAAFDEVANPEAVDVLIDHLNTPDATQRQLIAGALGRTQDNRAVSALVTLLDDTSAWVQQSAVWALGNVHTSEATAALVQALESDNPQTRILAIAALRERSAADVAPQLAARLTDNEPLVRREACAALMQLGTATCEAVIPLLSHPVQETRELAALVMRWVSDQRGVPALLRALEDDSAYVRSQAARALGRLRDKTAIPSLQSLQQADPDDRTRQTAEISLRKLGVTSSE